MTNKELTKYALDIQKTAQWHHFVRLVGRVVPSISKFFRGARTVSPLYKPEAGKTLTSRVMGRVKGVASKYHSQELVDPLKAGRTYPLHRPMLGRKAKQPIGIVRQTNPALIGKEPSGTFRKPLFHAKTLLSPTRAMGEAAHNISVIRDRGVLNWLRKHMRESRYYTHTPTKGGNISYRYKRSLPGRGLATAVTGPGFATQAMLFSDPNQPFLKRVGGAAGEGTLWGLSPRVGALSILGSEMTKGLFFRR